MSANVPVTAALHIPGGPAERRVRSPRARSAREQGVLADNPARSAGQTQLILSAPGKAATVRITGNRDRRGQPARHRRPDQGRSVGRDPGGPPSGAKVTAFTVVVTPLSGSGPVYASQISTAGASSGRYCRCQLADLHRLPPVPESLSAFLH